jgi:hypothetical protein
MNPDSIYLVALQQATMQYIGISLIISFPLMILVSQCALALREIAMNTREEYSGRSDYKALEVVADILFYISWLSLVAGVIFVLKSFG